MNWNLFHGNLRKPQAHKKGSVRNGIPKQSVQASIRLNIKIPSASWPEAINLHSRIDFFLSKFVKKWTHAVWSLTRVHRSSSRRLGFDFHRVQLMIPLNDVHRKLQIFWKSTVDQQQGRRTLITTHCNQVLRYSLSLYRFLPFFFFLPTYRPVTIINRPNNHSWWTKTARSLSKSIKMRRKRQIRDEARMLLGNQWNGALRPWPGESSLDQAISS